MNFKVTLLGDGGVGKTALVKRHLIGDFDKRYIATLGVEVHPIRFNSNYGPVCLNVWDCAGQEKFHGLGAGYYVKSEGLILMFDLTSINTFKNVDKWLTNYLRVVNTLPENIILCGSKCDMNEQEVTNEMIQEFVYKTGIKYFSISSKTNYNFDKPFLELSRVLTKHADLNFTCY